MQGLRRKAHGALGVQGLGAGTLDEFLADLLEGGDLARAQGDADLVDFLDNTNVRNRSLFSGVNNSLRRTGPSPKSFSGFWKDILNESRRFKSQSRPERRGSVR